MGFGFVSSLSGAKATEIQLDVIANNIANAQTTGFKQMSLSFKSELDKNQSTNDEMSKAQAPVREGKTYVSNTQGAVTRTGNPFDLAIQGDGYFAVQTQDGPRYTRNGSFTLDKSGNLITSRGDMILSSSGPMQIPEGKDIVIASDGQVSADQEVLGQIQVVAFDSSSNLKAEGGNYFSADGAAPASNPQFSLAQGHLESSNVNIMENITRLIQVTRTYEALQKTVAKQIESAKMANQLAKIG